MINITGHIYFDRDRTANVQGGLNGIANVTVVLQDVNTLRRIGVYTDNAGQFAFHEVPEGQYRIVEAYGEPAVASPANFAPAAQVGPVPVATVPPIFYAPNPPLGASDLDCVTPNTILVTAGTDNISNQNILNGPVLYSPIMLKLDSCAVVSAINLIDVADFGTMGAFAPGTYANSGASPNPYPGLAPDFTYMLPVPHEHVPDDGEYTLQNIMSNSASNDLGAWWRIADHTTGNEQGRMMVVNGFDPGAVFFIDTIDVVPHKNYMFSAWILDMFRSVGYANPAFGVEIVDENDEILYAQHLGELIPVHEDFPEWRQIGTVINSKDNTRLTVKFISEGPAALGNDYAIDDVSFNEIDLPLFRPVKTASESRVNVGETVTYTVTIENTCTMPMANVFFFDNIPDGMVFVPGSVIINNTPDLLANPNTGFTLPNITAGQTATVSFMAEAVAVPAINPTINTAKINYDYTPIEDGVPDTFTTESNEVRVLIRSGECDEGHCEQEFCRMYDVSLPITVIPFATPEIPDITCVGELDVMIGHRPCPSDETEFEYTLSQKIKVELPVRFGAQVCLDETCVIDDGECEESNGDGA